MKKSLFSLCAIVISSTVFAGQSSLYDIQKVSKDLAEKKVLQKHFTSGSADNKAAIDKIKEVSQAVKSTMDADSDGDDADISFSLENWDIAIGTIIAMIQAPNGFVDENQAPLAKEVASVVLKNIIAYQIHELDIKKEQILPYLPFFETTSIDEKNADQVKALTKIIVPAMARLKSQELSKVLGGGAFEALEAFVKALE